jgi:glucose-1-phosphate thymidylyltransferase
LLVHWAYGLFKAPLRSLLGDASIGPLDTVVLLGPPLAQTAVVELASERLSALMDVPLVDSHGPLAGVALLGSAAREVARALEPCRDADLDLLAVVERMAELGGQVRALPAAGCWRYTGATDSALELNRFLLSDLVSDVRRPESRGAIVEGTVQVHSSVIIERSTIRGPVVIGPGSRLLDAYIGPYTSIGADVCVEGAEIENSIVLGGTRISYLDRRLEGSVVGPAATICRDFRLPRAVRLRVGEGASVSLT